MALLIIGFLIIDVVLSIWVGKQVGGWMLLLWFVMAFFVGRQIMKGASKELTPQLQQAQILLIRIPYSDFNRDDFNF